MESIKPEVLYASSSDNIDSRSLNNQSMEGRTEATKENIAISGKRS